VNPFRPALIAITRRGAKHAAELAKQWPDAELFILSPWDKELEIPVTTLTPPLRGYVKELVENYSPLCFFCALGAVVRLAAPHLRSKKEDPAILAIDEMARFVIPVVSGHLGGANHYATEVAKVFGALPVITTASDSVGTLAVDLLGRELGWKVEADTNTLTRTAAHVVNGLPIALVQECGSRRWQEKFPNLDKNIHLLERIEQADPKQHKAVLWITQKQPNPTVAEKWPESQVLYRPPKGQGMPLSIGLGCDRGTPLETLRSALATTLADHHLEQEDITHLATIDIKGDEVGLLALAEEMTLPLTLYPPSQLAQVPVPSPSETVLRYTGTPSVSEAAALLAANTGMENLLVEKQRFKGPDGKNATVSIVLGS
jgi:cobalt-precorrin 5A hydrolase